MTNIRLKKIQRRPIQGSFMDQLPAASLMSEASLMGRQTQVAPWVMVDRPRRPVGQTKQLVDDQLGLLST